MADTAGRALGASSITFFLEVADIENLWFNLSLTYAIIYLIFMIVATSCLGFLERYHYIKFMDKDKSYKDTVNGKF